MPREEDHLVCELFLNGPAEARLRVLGKDYSGQPSLEPRGLARLWEVQHDPQLYGERLFDALFEGSGKGNLLAGFREALAIARHEDKRLRLRLHLGPALPIEVDELAFEMLYDARKELALGRSRDTAFSRYLSVDAEPPALAAGTPRMLVVLSAPRDLEKLGLPPLDREAMQRSLCQSLEPLGAALAWEMLDAPATLGNLRERLAGEKFDALFLEAHGLLRPDGTAASVVLEKEDGSADVVDENLFAQVFEDERRLRLLVLMCCHSGASTRGENSEGDPLGPDRYHGLGPALVRRGIPAVVALRRDISLRAAELFTRHFFAGLARDGEVDTAVNEARMQLYLNDVQGFEWATPTLFMRLADGRLWQDGTPGDRLSARRPATDNSLWDSLVRRIKRNDLLPILGPGMSRGLLPSAREIAAVWARQYGYPWRDPPKLPRVAQFIEMKLGRYIPHQDLAELLARDLLAREEVREQERLSGLGLSALIDKIAWRYFDRDENEPHRVLAELPISTYLTTNFDNLMTAALEWRGRPARRQACIWTEEPDRLDDRDAYKDLEGTKEEPLVFHLYGNDLKPEDQVLTEDDHLDFIRVISRDFDDKIPSDLHVRLSRSALLFLGYSVDELDCRVLFRGLVARMVHTRQPERLAVVLQLREDGNRERQAEFREYIEGCCGNLQIKICSDSVHDFLTELQTHWKRHVET